MSTAHPPREPAPMAPVTPAARPAPADPVPQEHVLTLTPDPVTGLADFAMIIEVPAPAGGASTFSGYREHPTLPLIARQDDFASAAAAAAWAAGERFATCIVAGLTWCALADDDSRWYADVGDQLLIVTRFAERSGCMVCAATRYQRSTGSDATIYTDGIASILTFERACEIASAFDAHYDVPLIMPGRRRRRRT